MYRLGKDWPPSSFQAALTIVTLLSSIPVLPNILKSAGRYQKDTGAIARGGLGLCEYGWHFLRCRQTPTGILGAFKEPVLPRMVGHADAAWYSCFFQKLIDIGGIAHSACRTGACFVAKLPAFWIHRTAPKRWWRSQRCSTPGFEYSIRINSN